MYTTWWTRTLLNDTKNTIITRLGTTRTLQNAQDLRLWVGKTFWHIARFVPSKTQCPIYSYTKIIILDIIGYCIVFVMQYVNRNDVILHWISTKNVCINKKYPISCLNLFLIFHWWSTHEKLITIFRLFPKSPHYTHGIIVKRPWRAK